MFKFFTAKNNYQWINALLIALSAALLCKETFIVSGIKNVEWGINVVVFIATLYAYLNYGNERRFSKKQFEALKNFGQLFGNPFFDATAGFIVLSIFFLHSLQSFVICFAITILSLIYFEPGFTGINFSIRKIYFAKTFLLALVWSLATVLLPASYEKAELSSSTLLFIFARRFLFIAALSIPFDIRDKEKDALLGFKNFVNLFGIMKSKIIALMLLFVFLLLTGIQYKINNMEWKLAAPMFISFIFSAVLISIYNKDKKSGGLILFFTDAMLLVQFLLIELFLNV